MIGRVWRPVRSIREASAGRLWRAVIRFFTGRSEKPQVGLRKENEQVKKFTISEVIDSLGVNKFTWSVFFFLGMAMVFDGYDYMVVSYTMPQISAEWALNKVQTGSLFYAVPAIVGALAAFLFVRKETKSKSLDELAQEATFVGH